MRHEEREKARKAAGLLDDGRSALAWDKDAVLWYARPGCDIERVKAWLPDKTISTGGGDAQAEFHDALTQAGLIVKGLPVMDGKRHRVATLEDKKGQKSGVYRGFLDRRPGGWFINYHRAETEKSVTNWKATGTEADPLPGSTFERLLARRTMKLNGRERPITADRRRKRRRYTTSFRAQTLPILIWCERGYPRRRSCDKLKTVPWWCRFLMLRVNFAPCSTSRLTAISGFTAMRQSRGISWWWAAR